MSCKAKTNKMLKKENKTEKQVRKVAQQFWMQTTGADAACFILSPECCIMGSGPWGHLHCGMTSPVAESDLVCLALSDYLKRCCFFQFLLSSIRRSAFLSDRPSQRKWKDKEPDRQMNRAPYRERGKKTQMLVESFGLVCQHDIAIWKRNKGGGRVERFGFSSVKKCVLVCVSAIYVVPSLFWSAVSLGTLTGWLHKK